MSVLRAKDKPKRWGLEGFEPPDKAGGPDFLRGGRGVPDRDRLFQQFFEFQTDFAGDFKTIRTWMEGKMFENNKPRRGGPRFVVKQQRVRAGQLGTPGSGIFDAEDAAGKSGIFAQLESLIVGLRARRIKNQNAESVTRPTVVAKEALEAGFFDARLFVDGGDRSGNRGSRSFAQARVVSLGTAQDGIDERDGSRTKVQGGDGAAVAGL